MKTAILSLIVSFGVLGLSFYQFQQYQREFEVTHQKMTQLEQQADSLEKKSDSLEKQAETQTSGQSILKKEIDTIASQQANLAPQKPFSWSEFETALLIRQAQNKLDTNYDTKTALFLLGEAQKRLDTGNNPALIAVADVLQRDRATLEQTQFANVNELWVKIGGLMDKVPQLPIRNLASTLEETAVGKDNCEVAAVKPVEGGQKVIANETMKGIAQETTKGNKIEANSETSNENTKETAKVSEKNEGMKSKRDAAKNSWKENVKKSLYELKDLVKIREHRKPIDPLLSESEQDIIKDRLTLLLEELRFAALSRDDTLYQTILKDAEQSVNNYFELQDEAVKQFHSSLAELKLITLAPTVPNVSNALSLLNAGRQ